MTFAAESHPTLPADLKEGCHFQADARFVEPSPALGRAPSALAAVGAKRPTMPRSARSAT